jgi:hypothetical protein
MAESLRTPPFFSAQDEISSYADGHSLPLNRLFRPLNP